MNDKRLAFTGVRGPVSFPVGEIMAVTRWFCPNDSMWKADLVVRGGMTWRVQDPFEETEERVNKAKAGE
jgi:hypothetical protein